MSTTTAGTKPTIRYQGVTASTLFLRLGGHPGTRHSIVVPSPGADVTRSVPPIASKRSAMPCSPVPYVIATVSKPEPSSATPNDNSPLDCDNKISAVVAPEYFATLVSASRTQK